MLTCNMDVEERSVWLRATPGAAAMAQPFYCTEAGNFYGRAHFATARTDKDSYILFYTLSGSGLIEQNDQRIELPAGSALLLNCRTPQSYCTAPGQSCWHHYWVHLDGAGVAAMEPLLLPGKKLTPVQLTGVKMQELFETLLGQMERSTVDSMVTMGLALHEMLALCARSILAQTEATSARQVILQAAAKASWSAKTANIRAIPESPNFRIPVRVPRDAITVPQGSPGVPMEQVASRTLKITMLLGAGTEP